MENEEFDLETQNALEEAKVKGKKREEEEEGEEEEEEESSCKKKKMEEETVDEETLAASSLHPKARSSEAISKIGAISHVTNMLANMDKTEWPGFFAKVQALYGPGKDHGVGDKSGSNQSTIDMKASDAVASKGPKTKDGMPKLNVKEDIEEMFNGQDLTEEFKDSVSTLFEAAVNARLVAETVRLEEEFETKLQEEIATFNEEVTSKLDTYLDYCVENWMKENEVAVESTLRNELMDEFIGGLKNLFVEHYIDVPENKVDVLEAMAEKVAALETKLDESITENAQLKTVIAEASAHDIFVDLASDLALTQKEKFAALAEGIEFDGDLDTYAKKLMIVKENYFKNEAPARSSNIEEETFEGEVVNESRNIDPSVNRYVEALRRTVK